jgi:hypothetical protein
MKEIVLPIILMIVAIFLLCVAWAFNTLSKLQDPEDHGEGWKKTHHKKKK